MLKVALTGGIGSGKSTVGEMFQSLGATVVDSDQISRDVIDRGTPGFDEVLNFFGDEILTDGNIDRAKLGSVVFDDPEKRAVLEKIIHPKVRERFNAIADNAGESEIVINQIPLLVETMGAGNFDVVITVSSDLEIRKERLLKRGMRGYEIDKRIAAQASDVEREAIADFVINNSADLFKLQSDVENIFEELKSRASHN